MLEILWEMDWPFILFAMGFGLMYVVLILMGMRPGRKDRSPLDRPRRKR
jgi:hypothetical protein